MISEGNGVAGVALGASAAYCFYNCCISVYAMKHYTLSRIDLFKFFIKKYTSFAYMIIVLAALHYILPSIDILAIILKLVIFYVASIPLVYYANKETHTVSIMLKILEEKIWKRQ